MLTRIKHLVTRRRFLTGGSAALTSGLAGIAALCWLSDGRVQRHVTHGARRGACSLGFRSQAGDVVRIQARNIGRKSSAKMRATVSAAPPGG
jgi:hypothetical protein